MYLLVIRGTWTSLSTAYIVAYIYEYSEVFLDFRIEVILTDESTVQNLDSSKPQILIEIDNYAS